MIWPVGSSPTTKGERSKRGEVAPRQHLSMLTPSLTVKTYVAGTSQIVQSTYIYRAESRFLCERKSNNPAPTPPIEGGHLLIENMPDRPRVLYHLSFHP
jgi:hypothetical protein